MFIDLEPTVGHEQQGTRRALVVSYEPFHRSGMATICPITTRPAKYPGEVAVPRGEGRLTKDAVILCHQIRTIDLRRVSAWQIQGRSQYLTDRELRRRVRVALAQHLSLDLPGALDGAA